MQVTAVQKTTRQTSRKLSLVANEVRKMSLTDAIKQLSVMDRRSAQVILKVMRQAVANATHNHGAKFEDLVLKEIVINEGPRYRRFQAVSRGRAHGIIKRTSHIKIILEVKETKTTEKPTAKKLLKPKSKSTKQTKKKTTVKKVVKASKKAK